MRFEDRIGLRHIGSINRSYSCITYKFSAPQQAQMRTYFEMDLVLVNAKEGIGKI